jgi:transcriptional regulator with XRE-family HTH domain
MILKGAAMDTNSLLDALKRALKARGLTYHNVAVALGVSEPTVKRMMAQGNLKVERLLALCEAIGIELEELAHAARKQRATVAQLSRAQETALLKKPRLLSLFHLLLNNWTVDEILHRFAIEAPECQQLLSQLDRLKLINLAQGNRVKLQIPRQVEWPPGGPMVEALGERALLEFVRESSFLATDELIRYTVREVSPATHAAMLRRLAALYAEFHELADQDFALPASSRLSVGLQMASRPFVFSAFAAIARR